MSELLSAKWVMFGSVVLNVVGSLLTPLAATLHYSFFIAIRVIQGLGGVSKQSYTNIKKLCSDEILI